MHLPTDKSRELRTFQVQALTLVSRMMSMMKSVLRKAKKDKRKKEIKLIYYYYYFCCKNKYDNHSTILLRVELVGKFVLMSPRIEIVKYDYS